jgi:hypothetical protein
MNTYIVTTSDGHRSTVKADRPSFDSDSNYYHFLRDGEIIASFFRPDSVVLKDEADEGPST